MKNFFAKNKNTIIGVFCILVILSSVFVHQHMPADTEIKENECIISVNCSDILNIGDLGDKADFIPEDGVILKDTLVKFEAGKNAFDLLYELIKQEKIHIDFAKNTGSNSAYIKGIANIYEGDFGSMSGWYYLVNGEMLSVSSSEYEVKDGDKIEWIYSCDMNKLFE